MQVEAGEIVLMQLYDVADEIALEKIPQDIFAGKLPVRQKLVRVATKAIELVRPPAAVELGHRAWEGASGLIVCDIAVHFFDFGVICLVARIPVEQVSLDEFVDRVLELEKEAEIERQLSWEFDRILEGVAEALKGAHPARDFREDFSFFVLRHTNTPLCRDNLKDYPRLVSMLHGESRPMNAQQIRFALENSFSYFDDDLIVLNYDNAIIVDDEDCSDVILLIEYAVVQVLEARYYDETLKAKLQELYLDMDRRLSYMQALFTGRWSALARRGMKLMLEAHLMTDHLTSSVQVTEDVYYAQIYTRALRIFDTRQWLSKVDDKLRSMKEAYDLLENEIEEKRSTTLEWIIIVLIFIEALPLIQHVHPLIQSIRGLF